MITTDRPPAQFDAGLDLPWVESPFFSELLPQRELTAEEERQAKLFHERGYLIVEDAFSPDLVDRVRATIAPLFRPDAVDPRKSPNRFQDAWRDHPAVREMATDAGILDLLRRLYGREPVPFQTLNFERGSEQRAHSDTVHFNVVPRGYMCGVWVALEDVGPDNGTLYYYPGSNRLPDYDFNDLGLRYLNPNRLEVLEHHTYDDYDRYEDFVERLMGTHGLVREELSARRGSALIWAAGLVHGGGRIRDPATTRWSQVTHVYFADCLYYVPMLSNRVTGDIYLKRVTDVKSGEIVPHRYYGLTLPEIPVDGIYKLYFDVDGNGAEAIRLISNRDIKHLAEDNQELVAALRAVERSPSHRLGRMITAPGRLLRRLLG